MLLIFLHSQSLKPLFEHTPAANLEGGCGQCRPKRPETVESPWNMFLCGGHSPGPSLAFWYTPGCNIFNIFNIFLHVCP
jgi:hypothetical protein